MLETVLFVGNGVNNISNSKSWENLLKRLHKEYYDNTPFDEIKKQPFPMIYEQIVAYQLKNKTVEKVESKIKKLIADDVKEIKPNKVHNAIMNGSWKNIITANYEFNLMRNVPRRIHNEGCVKELIYSVFRNFKDLNKNYWHLHGDAKNVNSINLGYEHYCGQLQHIREYVTGGYRAKEQTLSKLFKQPLLKRSYLNTDKNYSWLDFFFKDNTTLKIIGFKLDLEELDLWWLLTYRAKIVFGAKKNLKPPKKNKIEYFIPKEYTIDNKGNLMPTFKAKQNLMEKLDITVTILDIKHSKHFYLEALK